MQVLLAGVVGSTAYGLAGPDSDVDRLGVFAAPTESFHGLTTPQPTFVTSKPDSTYHEAGKFCRLALTGNPTVTELLWLDSYDVMSPFGARLVKIRSAFLSRQRVRDAYLGYAEQQFRKLESRGGSSFSSDTAKRTAKHARHLYRLCHQGHQLYATGELSIRVSDPEHFHDFGNEVAGGNVGLARDMLARYERAFEETTSPIAEKPNAAIVEDWLISVREVNFECGCS
jgi:predicted nucleotidyltransferase